MKKPPQDEPPLNAHYAGPARAAHCRCRNAARSACLSSHQVSSRLRRRIKSDVPLGAARAANAACVRQRGGCRADRTVVAAAGSLLIATAGSGFAPTAGLAGVLVWQVEALPAADSRKLLFGIVPGLGKQAQALADLCEGRPLALELAAGVLVTQKKLTAAAYIKKLKEGQAWLVLSGCGSQCVGCRMPTTGAGGGAPVE